MKIGAVLNTIEKKRSRHGENEYTKSVTCSHSTLYVSRVHHMPL